MITTILGMFTIAGFELFLALAVVIWLFAFWIWMLVDAICNKSLTPSERTAWVVAIVLTHALGGLFYYQLGRKKTARV
ncbi:MAG TPA: PLDc N-terminal domain-containing protein [Candidatus Cybelea sp.]|jgi:hypothetical protein|nr:PLDc N-terminal domain-containing protein [Candidatus Cybelea sp.]